MSDTSSARTAARSLTAVSLNQAAQVAGSVLFVLLVPRRLGAGVYGQLAFCFAFITLVQMAGELGYQEIFARFLPQAGGHRRWVRQLLAIKLAVGAGLGLVSIVLIRSAAGWLTPDQGALAGLTVAARVWSSGPFALLLGLGRTWRWSVETTWRQIVLTLLLLASGASLTPALAALALHEAVFLVVGLWWARDWILPVGEGLPGNRTPGGHGPGDREGRPNVFLEDRAAVESSNLRAGALLRFGFAFSLANLALVALFRISPMAVEWLSGDHAQVGYFDLAQGGLLLVYTFLGQVSYAFVPLLARLTLAGDEVSARLWLGRLVRYAGVLVSLAAGGMWAVARPAAPLVFGPAYAPAADAFRAIAPGLLALPVAWGAMAHSTVQQRPGRKLRAALLGLAVFAAAALALRDRGAAGIAIAFSLALWGYALGFGAGALQAAQAGGAGWRASLGCGAVFGLLLFWEAPSLAAALAGWGGLAVLYVVLLIGLGAVRPVEVVSLVRSLRE